MKMTFEVPDELAVRFRSAVAGGERSRVICELLEARVREREAALESACAAANALTGVGEDMRDWEKLNESDD